MGEGGAVTGIKKKKKKKSSVRVQYGNIARTVGRAQQGVTTKIQREESVEAQREERMQS